MQKVTMKDIAERVGVSKTTISMVINNKDTSISEETKNKIKQVIKETGYIPNNAARGLNTNKSGTIAIIIPDISNPFFSEISRAIEDEANELGYNVILCNSDNNEKKEKKYVKLLISKLIDGVIIIPGENSFESIELLEKNGIKFLFLDRYIQDFKDYPGVFFNNNKAIKEGVKYLISKGKKKIVFISGPKNIIVNKERIDGYKEVMKENNLYNKEYIFESEFSLEGGINVTNKILEELKDIDSIFYSNDIMAIGGVKVLKRNGFKIPQDISVLGLDGIKFSKMIEPELTTIAQPIYSMGEVACKMIVDIINGKDIKDKYVYFDPTIRDGGTV